MSVFGISFLAPFALLGLLALPALWFILRASPPAPVTAPFPPITLLRSMEQTEETPVHTPWWLLLMRLLLLAALILAFAGPILRATDQVTIAGDGPVLIALESDWSTAEDWENRQRMAAQLIEVAASEGRAVAVTAFPQPSLGVPLPADRAEALATLDLLEPHPVPIRRDEHLSFLRSISAQPAWQRANLVYLAGSLAGETLPQWDELEGFEAVQVAFGSAPSLALSLSGGSDGPSVIIAQPTAEGAAASTIALPPAAQVTAFDRAGRLIGNASLVDVDGEVRPEVSFDLPLDIRNDIARIEYTGVASASTVLLVDDSFERRRIGIVGGERVGEAQPLLSGLTYVERALAPIADLIAPRSGDAAAEIDDMIASGVHMIVLVDIGSLLPSTQATLEAWIDRGGVLVRFASRSLAQSGDRLVPVPLRAVDRLLGGTLTWEEPQTIGSFSETGPFAGLTVPDDILITRQVLTQPGPQVAERTYVELSDATPLVTGAELGEGHLVLFHVTADPSWSNIPISGLFVDMMQRLNGLTQASVATSTGVASAPTDDTVQTDDSTDVFAPRTVLNGFGERITPPAHVAAPDRATLQAGEPSLEHPPGLYGSSQAPFALNLFRAPPQLGLLDPAAWASNGARLLDIPEDTSTSLRPMLFSLVALLALADTLAVLMLAGSLRGMRLARAAAMVLVPAMGLFAFMPTQSHAQEGDTSSTDIARMIEAANTTRFAYVETGIGELDRRTREGLSGLSRIITRRTAFEPAEPMAVNPETDELAFFPLIYWPMPDQPITVTDGLVTRIDAYMNNGGTILFDTRDETGGPSFTNAALSVQTQNLRALLDALDIPPLEPVPQDHVLTKAFYLIESFPGRFASGPLWVEALPTLGPDDDPVGRPARGGDGVSPILITGNDYASAWALSEDGRPLYATSPPDPVQREFAFRTGVNIAMYVITGNYKADQVHVPALLERLER